MSRKNRVVLFLGLASFAVLFIAGCGNGVTTTPPIAAGFSNSSLSGTYAFAISGTNAGGFFTIAGSFQANGSGVITTGTEDINSPGTSVGVATNVPITGSYSVRADGRTVATITSTAPAVSFGLDFVLLNNATALVIRVDNNGTASGSINLQSSSAFNLATLAGALAFNVAGVDSTVAQNPEASAGLVNVDASGNITGGLLDDNDNFTVNLNLAISAAAGAVSNPANGRGTVTITTTGTLTVTRHFAYYVVDANHLKLIETDSAPILAGDAFRQTSTAVSGSFAFTLAGATNNLNGVFAAGGILNTDGAGNILNTSVEDIDDGGAISAAAGSSVTGTYTVSGGRGTMQLNGPEVLHLVFYPSSGGLLMLDVDTVIVAGGTALAQSGAPFSNTSINNGYGLNFTGVTALNTLFPNELDVIAQFNANGAGTFSGALDLNNLGFTSSLALNGSYTVSASGRGTATLHTSAGNVNIIFYMASGSRVLFIEPGTAEISAGVFATQ